jgi:hypothetical protein
MRARCARTQPRAVDSDGEQGPLHSPMGDPMSTDGAEAYQFAAGCGPLEQRHHALEKEIGSGAREGIVQVAPFLKSIL